MPLTSSLRWVARLMCPETYGAAAGCYSDFFLPNTVSTILVYLGKLAVGEIMQTKTKTHIPTQNTHFKVDVNLFPKHLQTYSIFML